jgi:hypothetical protein
MDTASTTARIGNGAQDTPGDSTDGQAFLQERVALFGVVAALPGLTFFLFRSIAALGVGRLTLLHPSMLLHLAAACVSLPVWLIARRGRYRARTSRVLEIAALVASCGLYIAMGMALPIGFRPDYLVLLIMTMVMSIRSILVPSTARQTALLGGVLGVMLAVGAYGAAVGADISGFPPPIRRELLPIPCAIRSLAWWLLTTWLAVVTSHVIYGLRREIREARRLGQYTLGEKLGEGGMGVVYRASHAMLRRPTAVKLLAPEKAGLETIARFEREVRLTARLTHPNTITIFDYGRTPEGIFYYAMELLEGANLEEVVEVGGAMPAARVIHVASQIAGALVEAHTAGLIHRDIKPANIILCERGGIPDVVKVVDFGLVREVDAGDTALSRAGSMAGTPLYLAPETIRSPEQVDARADIYALGCVMYYLLAGDHLFRGSSTMEVCAHHLHTEPTPIAERAGAALPADLEAVVMACLRKNPTERVPSAAALLTRLHACADTVTWSAEQAHAWWAENGVKMQAHHKAQARSAASTIAIDLKRR